MIEAKLLSRCCSFAEPPRRFTPLRLILGGQKGIIEMQDHLELHLIKLESAR